MSRTPMRRVLVAGAATVATSAAYLMVGGTSTTATPSAEDEAPLTLRAGAKAVTATKYGKVVELDLGTYAVAGDEPFEIRATRKSYKKPIVAKWKRSDGDVRLPKGSAKRFRGLRQFYKVTLRNKRGKKVFSKKRTFCPNGESVRVRPDAPAVSTYPWDCSARLPFTLGSVWGIQAGHGVPTPGYMNVRGLEPGKYHATVTITKKYREALGISKAEGSAKVNVRVRKSKCRQRGCRARHDHESRSHQSHSRIAVPGARPTGRSRVPDSGPRPDLRSVPAWGIKVRKGKFLAFSATVWNAGDSPLVVDGFRRKNKALMDAYQYFFDAEGNQTGYDKVGTLEWDPREDHHHWHFTDFARYRLVDKDKHGVVRSKKEAFCLANTDAVDYTIDGANWRPDNTDLHTACGSKGSLALREVLDSGNGDTYEQFRPGQSFVLKGIPNGTYYIEVRANPVRNLVESDTTNNVAYRKVILRGKPGARTVKVPPVGMVGR